MRALNTHIRGRNSIVMHRPAAQMLLMMLFFVASLCASEEYIAILHMDHYNGEIHGAEISGVRRVDRLAEATSNDRQQSLLTQAGAPTIRQVIATTSTTLSIDVGAALEVSETEGDASSSSSLGLYLSSQATSLTHIVAEIPLHKLMRSEDPVEYHDHVHHSHHRVRDHAHSHERSTALDQPLRGGRSVRNSTQWVLHLRNVPQTLTEHSSDAHSHSSDHHFGKPWLSLHAGAISSRPSRSSRKVHAEMLSYSTATSLLMQQRGIVVRTLQETDPHYTRSIVFVASGYTASEQSKFNQNVSSCVSALQGLDASITADPWPRYFPLLNLYSVFEASSGSGASRLAGPDYKCDGLVQCGPKSVANNLGCAYGTPDAQRLGCTSSMVLNLASFAPSADIVVVLVNDVDYGGSAFPSVATIAAAPAYMTYLLLHELNHAVAGLGDEFSYGFSDPNVPSLPPNCAATTTTTLLDWNYWVTSGKVPATPTAGCTFDNLYRPTSSSCIMNTPTATSMCSVCKERLLQQLFVNGVGLRLDQPRCPALGFDIYLNSSDTVTLAINHVFVLQNSNVSVTWTLPDGSVVSGVPTVSVRGNMLSAGVNYATVTIADLTPLIRTARRPSGMSLTSQFTMRLWQSSATCTTKSFTSSAGVVYTYCGTCTSGTCSSDVLVTPVTYAVSDTTDLSTAQTAVTVTAAILGGLGALALLVVLIVYCCHTRHVAQQVYRPAAGEGALQGVIAVIAVLSFAVAVVVIVFAVVYLPKAALFGTGVLIGCIILAGTVYLIALLKLVAVIFRAPVLVAVTGVVLCVFGCGLFGIGIYAVYIYRNQGTDDLLRTFASMWLDYTGSHPNVICEIQKAFTCSGFYYSCTPTASSYCPAGCTLPNRDYVNACSSPWMDWIATRSIRVGVVCLLCGFLFALGAILDCILCVRVLQARSSARGRRSYRRDERAPVAPITSEEVQQFKHEFNKIALLKRNGGGGGRHGSHDVDDVDMTAQRFAFPDPHPLDIGAAPSTSTPVAVNSSKRNDSAALTLQGEDVITFVEQTFGETPVGNERVKLATAGPLTCEELLRMYFPHYIISQIDPRQLTAEEAEEAKDSIHLQRLQYAKLQAFMTAAGALSPEALQRIYQKYTESHFVTNSREVLTLIAQAAKEHSATVEAAMCRGLSKQELEGLRCAWATINPKISGDLNDDQIDHLYQWTHGTILHSHEHFVRWKDMLDVRKSGLIGWGEFCYPFAQRAMLSRAREYLFSNGREVPHEMLSRAQVAEEFGPLLVDQVFMVFEDQVPSERALEQALKNLEAHASRQAPNGTVS